MTLLDLSLEPVSPARIPRHATTSTAGAGYRLVLDGAVPLDQDDPLLAACGARVVSLRLDDEHLDTVQDAGFAPGSRLRLELAPDPADRNRVAVFDDDGVVLGGLVPKSAAPVVAAALEHGVELLAVVVWERRHLGTGDRVGVRALIAPAATTTVAPAARPATSVEALPSRPRIVLAVGRDWRLRWWDPRAGHGPLELGDIPLSPDLEQELRELERRMLAVDEDDDEVPVPAEWRRRMLLEHGRRLWRRARWELRSRYVVGYQPVGAPRPIYVERPVPESR